MGYTIPVAVPGAGDPPAEFNTARAAILDLDTRVTSSTLRNAIPKMGTPDTRFSVPPSIKARDWFGDDQVNVYLMPFEFSDTWRFMSVDVWFFGIGNGTAGVKIGLYGSSAGKPTGSPLSQMTKTGTDLGGTYSGGPLQKQFAFNETGTYRDPGLYFVAYKQYGTGMSVSNMEVEPASMRVRVSIGAIGPSPGGFATDWFMAPHDSGNLPAPITSADNISILPWMSIGFSMP